MSGKEAIPRSKLIGMQVYNPDGTYVGKIEDLAFIPGEKEILVKVRDRYGRSTDVEWDNLGGVGDIVILKEKVEVKPPPEKEKVICPTCGKPATYIQQYKRWYCYNCKKYL
ncbi:hypothetical protein B6U74_02820 [Candidatus Bathyarchaeota archaeon ex4484_205]|nr:MAG: hypothetical protein B6U74_02820 [Candidatus Bathyarchaeota archaeon ex4484_205]RLG67131.1 MAG: hypothetical protein DRN93_05050 [archaeon]HDN18049.1 hypothetical protein [Candidatus Bathyarchaeota archaeon]